MTARLQIQRLARELNEIDPEREACTSCGGGGQGDYGPCPDCGGNGSWPRETYRHTNIPELHERPEHEAAALDWTFFYSHAAEA